MKLFCKIVLLCLIVVASISCRKNVSDVNVCEKGYDFRLETLDHNRFYLNQQKDKGVVLIFWETWCHYSKNLMADMTSLQESSPGDDFVIAAVCGDPENINEVKRIVKNLNINYPVLLDKGSVVSKKYKITAYPTTVILDKNGVISYIRAGYHPTIINQIKANITMALNANRSDK